ncbi:MAG: hypothetical protein WAS07_07495 [Micropruina sp.]|nr:hypothetical protein [Micropruina sp.]
MTQQRLTTITVAGSTPSGWQAVTASGHRVELPSAALMNLRFVRNGQRLHAEVLDGRVVRAWLA